MGGLELRQVRGRVVTPGGVVAGAVRFGEVIAAVEAGQGAPERWVVPGFVDTHVHGGGGADAMDGPGGVAGMARFHLRHGTTTLCPTTITRPWGDVLGALRGIEEARRPGADGGPDGGADGGATGGALIHGAHLEGPFVNPQRLGAQPPFAIEPELGRVREALASGVVRVVTIAPELPGADLAIDAFVRAGVRVSLGHSATDYDAATAAIGRVQVAGGVVAGTHLFNAMGGIEGRKPGLAGAVLASPVAYAELILDMHHVHPGAFRLAHAALGRRLMLITDAMRGAGTVDGDSELGGQAVFIRGGVARLANGTLAGSVLTMDAALRNAVASGVPVEAAVALVSFNAARYLGLHDRGEIVPGRRADLVVLDGDLAVQEVWVGGVRQV